MKYRIFDSNRNILDSDKEIDAKSPIEAVRKFYKKVERSKDNSGNVVVHSAVGCYAYWAFEPK